MRRSFIFACLFASAHSLAQEYPFVYYTPKDGLVNGRVKAIKQDSKGLLYFITYGGLSVYDGTQFSNYTLQNGLANDVVNDVAEIHPDTVLVSTNAHKLNMLVKGRIEVYPSAGSFYPITNHFLKSSNGQWYITADEGLFLLRNKKFIRLPLLFNGADLGQNLDDIREWNHYFLITPWSNQWNTGVIVYDRIRQQVTATFPKDIGSGVITDKQNRIWIAGNKGFRCLDTTALKKGVLQFVASSNSPPFFNKQHSLYFDDAGNTWTFSRSEVCKMSPDQQYQTVSPEQGIKGGINNLFRDREGIVWIALDGAGAVKLRNTHFQLLNGLQPGKQKSFSAMAVYKDTIWCYSPADHSVYRKSSNDVKQFNLPGNIDVTALQISGDTLFISDARRVLYVKNKNHPLAYRQLFTAMAFHKNSLGNSIVDPYGAVLQLVQKKIGDNYITVIKNNQVVFEHKISYMADQMAIDNQQRLWIATRNNHIMVFQINPFQHHLYLQLLHDYSTGLPIIHPRSIAVDNTTNVWVGTRFNGIYRFRQDDTSLKLANHFTTKEGLTDNFVLTLYCDAQNTLWAGTQTGLDKIFLKDGKYLIANPGKNNNVFQTVFKIGVTKNGTAWALNNDGSLIRILPTETLPLSHPPPLLLTSVKVNDSLWLTGASDFSYYQNNFFFTVAAPSFLDERSIRYSYWLEGSRTSHWSEASNVSSFNFLNLAPGQYTLHVKAAFPEEKYPPQELTYSFRILPAWWQTTIFWVGIALLLVLLVTLAIRSYYKRKLEKHKIFLEKQQAIEKERTRIATDMHDDLGAGLSRIKFLSETIGIKKQQEQPIEEDINKIREYSHQMIDKMGEIVWALNEKNDSLNDLLSFTRAYATDYLSQNGISCSVTMPEAVEEKFVSGEFRRNIFLSVKEALHNVVKHAAANRVCIDITISETLSICIQDDGQGFSKSRLRPYSNGLNNMEKRMQEIGGRFAIESEGGTAVFINAPL
jgi:signal transduction histidine kinase/ligand-binding sensor domain-containing protein